MKNGSAAQFAVSVQVPLEAIIATVALALAAVPVTGPTEQTFAVPAIVGMLLELVVAVTTKLLL